MTKLKVWLLKNLDLIIGGIALVLTFIIGHILRWPGPVNKGEARHFNNIQEFHDWFNARFLGFWLLTDPRKDCDDYAEYLQRESLKDKFIVSLQLLRDGTVYGKVKNGVYYGIKVTDRIEPHCGCLLLLGNGQFWYAEPQTGAVCFIVNRD